MGYDQMISLYFSAYLDAQLNFDEHPGTTNKSERDGRSPFLSKNICSIAIKALLISSLGFADNKLDPETFGQRIHMVLQAFYPMLRMQFLLAVLFRKNSGRLRGSASGDDPASMLSPEKL